MPRLKFVGCVISLAGPGVDPGLSRGGGHNKCQRHKVSRGMWGHVPPEIFENLIS